MKNGKLVALSALTTAFALVFIVFGAYFSSFDLSGSGKCRVQNAKCRVMDDFRLGRKSTIIEIVFVYKVNLF